MSAYTPRQLFLDNIWDPEVVRELSTGAHQLALYLARHMGPEGSTWRTNETMAADLAVTTRTIQNRATELEAAGWIVRVYFHDRATTYWARDPLSQKVWAPEFTTAPQGPRRKRVGPGDVVRAPSGVKLTSPQEPRREADFTPDVKPVSPRDVKPVSPRSSTLGTTTEEPQPERPCMASGDRPGDPRAPDRPAHGGAGDAGQADLDSGLAEQDAPPSNQPTEKGPGVTRGQQEPEDAETLCLNKDPIEETAPASKYGRGATIHTFPQAAQEPSQGVEPPPRVTDPIPIDEDQGVRSRAEQAQVRAWIQLGLDAVDGDETAASRAEQRLEADNVAWAEFGGG